jgi:hypothetical protein
LGAAIGLVGVGPAGAEPDPPLIERAADGSVDFSSWSATTEELLGSAAFTRNSITYRVDMSNPTNGRWAGSTGPLVANRVTDTTSGQAAGHTYSFSDGDGVTSNFYVEQNGQRQVVSGAPATLYSKDWNGGQAVAQALTLPVDGGEVVISEVLRVTSTGSLAHDYTLTNPGDSPIAGLTFGAELDTELDGNDQIPLIKSAGKSIYIHNDTFRLYLTLTGGDRMMAGSWGARATLNGWSEITDAAFQAGQTVVQGVDSAIEYQLVDRTILAGGSITMSTASRIYEAYEIEQLPRVKVVYWDDELDAEHVPAGGPVVLTGQPFDPVVFTADDARSHLASGYIMGAIENEVEFFDDDNSTDQQITVHVTHQHSYGELTTTRTIVYTGAGDLTPQPVTCVVEWSYDEDLALGVTTYESEAGCPEVPSPEIEGLVPSIAVVPAIPAVTRVTPADATITVTYAPPESDGGDPEDGDPEDGDPGGGEGTGGGANGSGGSGAGLPLTGPAGISPVGGTALALVLAGLALVAAARHRRLIRPGAEGETR